jgi:hypothetical protein
VRLKNIVGLHYSAIGQSHYPTLIDIVLGTLRFGINSFTREDPSRLETAKMVPGARDQLLLQPQDRESGEVPRATRDSKGVLGGAGNQYGPANNR